MFDNSINVILVLLHICPELRFEEQTNVKTIDDNVT